MSPTTMSRLFLLFSNSNLIRFYAFPVTFRKVKAVQCNYVDLCMKCLCVVACRMRHKEIKKSKLTPTQLIPSHGKLQISLTITNCSVIWACVCGCVINLVISSKINIFIIRWFFFLGGGLVLLIFPCTVYLSVWPLTYFKVNFLPS